MSDIALKTICKTKIGGANRSTFKLWSIYMFFGLKDSSIHFLNAFIIIFNPENMGIETFFVKIYALLAKIQPKTSFLVMAALICIKDPHGTFWQLFNIANRFLRVFVSLVVPIKNIFLGCMTTFFQLN